MYCRQYALHLSIIDGDGKMRIDEYIKSIKISKREFSKRADMPVSTLCRIISGETVQPRINQQKKIVAASNGLISFSDMWPIESVLHND